MDMNRLTHQSREAPRDARTFAVRPHQNGVDGEHPPPALLDQENGLVPRPPEQVGADIGEAA
jgi:hypothetical protein